ncbi:hypothetical protein LWI28_024510 [Acer negundo]|uniref:Uncharacterized protein n=1 Tax=Acer negundo TaxID=4023 RepID=A0AAD5NZ21_ACENE|nr:hypothetical protein LWI28_024510 [Acer negundo]
MDMLVTTADPVLESPIVTVNTVLSLMAIDYPTNKLACYVSDNGYFPLTFYALVEASKFAKLRIPFFKKYNVQEEYEGLGRNIEDAAKKSASFGFDLCGELTVFSDIKCRNHLVIFKDIFAAGSETLSRTIEWAMSEMLKNPRVLKEAQAEVRHVFDRKGKIDETGINELKS